MVERRRRKKARVQVESSSEDESSASDIREDSPSELSGVSDDETSLQSGSASTSTSNASQLNNHIAAADPQHPRERIHKAPHNSSEEFNQVFLKLVTEQFGEELAKLREANDFTPASITQLVAGLKQGVDIFDTEQRKML